MANTASRLSANGSLTISGSFDEVTGPISKNGLIGYWDMQYLYSSNTNYWFDQSGSNNHIDFAFLAAIIKQVWCELTFPL
jgi:hypothetical protein